MRIGLGYVRSVGEDEAEALVAGAAVRRRRRPRAPRARRGSPRSRRSSPSGACDEWGPRRELLWQLGATPRRRERGRRLAPARAPARADRGDARAARRRPTGSGCSPTTATRRSRSASTRWSCCARTCRRRRLERASCRRPARRADRGRRHGRRAPAPVDREGHRLHAARGRARPDEPDRPAAGLRGAPRDRPRRAADPRARPLRARRPQRERPRRAASRRSARSPAASRTRPRCAPRCRPRTISGTADRGRMRAVTRLRSPRRSPSLSLGSSGARIQPLPAAVKAQLTRAEVWQPACPVAALAPAPADRALLGLRRPRAHGAARRARGRRRRRSRRVLAEAARDALPDPPHAARRHVRAGARTRPTAT